MAADRLPRRPLLFWSDAGRALIVLTIALLGWTHHLQVWHLIALGFSFGFVGAFFLPAYRAMPPQLVAVEDLPSANALTELSGQLGQLLGPLLGATLVAWADPSTAFAFDGLTFAFSAASLSAIRRTPQPSTVLVAHRAAGRSSGSMGRGLREALAYIRASPWLLATIVIPAFGNAGFGSSMIVALPKLVHDDYGVGVWLLGAIGATTAAGRIGAVLLVGQLHLRRRGVVAFGADILAALALLAFVVPAPAALRPAIAILAGALFGLGGGTFQTIWVTLLHELVPNDKLGRVASIDLLGSFCLQPIGFALAGLVTDHAGPAWVFACAGALNLVLYSAPLGLRSIRAVE